MPARDPVAVEWGRKIRDAREYLGLSQTEFGRRVGIQTAATVSDWERGLRTPQPVTRTRLIRIFAKVQAARVEEQDGAAV